MSDRQAGESAQVQGVSWGAPSRLPHRIGIDANGYGWRAWDDVDWYSMVPTNADNGPIPQPVTWFVPENESAVTVLGEVVDWLGVPDWAGPQLPEPLARLIARVLEQSGRTARGELERRLEARGYDLAELDVEASRRMFGEPSP